MKDKLKPSIKGHVTLKVDNEVIYDGHNEVQATALDIILRGLSGGLPITLDKIKIIDPTESVVDTIEGFVTSTVTSNVLEIQFFKSVDSSYTIAKLSLNESEGDIQFSLAPLLAARLITSSQILEITWTITLTI